MTQTRLAILLLAGAVHAAAVAGDPSHGAGPAPDPVAVLARTVSLTVYFRTGSVALDTDSAARLRLLGEYLRDLPALHVHVDAYSDRRGNNARNRHLARARADAVVRVLAEAGLPRSRIRANAWGESRARALPDDTDGLIFDRRADIGLRLEPQA
jgi:outer membrane protein OmpA-like peptidoglycan-associated protein